MTGIINEQLTLNPEITIKQNTGNITVNEPQTCVSPVYSLPDEDRLFTQAALACKENFINNVESHSSTQNVDKGYFNDNKKLQTPVEIVDLCSDEEDNRFNISTIDVEVHRAMSDLSIIDTEGQPEIGESQSVLENFEHVTLPIKTSNIKEMKVDSIVHNATITKNVNGTEVTEKQSHNILDKFNQTKTHSDILLNINYRAQEKAISVIPNMKKHILEEQNVTSEVTKSTIIKTIKCTPQLLNKSTREITQIAKEIVAINVNAKKPRKKRNDKNKSKDIKVARRKKKAKQDGDSTQNGTNELKKSNIGRTKVDLINNREKIKNKNDIIPTEINTKKKYNNNNLANLNTNVIKTTTPKIYNKEIVDDLSWVENIRYVREIATNEFDPVEDSFWECVTFPSEWNDLEFNVY